jgi:hypothetical protein
VISIQFVYQINNQAATDAKQRPGFQARNRANGMSEIEGKVTRVGASAHRYDEDLTSIDLITADGYEPRLPLSLVLHIDYQKAPSVVQRFGDVKRLITQDA